jgi:hypothetical protein
MIFRVPMNVSSLVLMFSLVAAVSVTSSLEAQTWRHPVDGRDAISSGSGNVTDYPLGRQIAMNDNGKKIIVWTQANRVYMAQFENGVWVYPRNEQDYISPADIKVLTPPSVAMDNLGNVVIAWPGQVGSFHRIYKSEYRYGSWTHPKNSDDYVSVDLINTKIVDPAKVRISENGDAIIVWVHDGQLTRIFMSERRNNSWNNPKKETDSLDLEGDVRNSFDVAMNDSGHTIVVWGENTVDSSDSFASTKVYKSEYLDGSWKHPSSIDDYFSPMAYEEIYYPQVAMNNSGEAIIIWDQDIENEDYTVFRTKRFGAWQYYEKLSSSVSSDKSIAMNSNGDIVLAWCESDKTLVLLDRRQSIWKYHGNIAPDIPGINAMTPSVAIDDAGNAIVVWSQDVLGAGNQLFKSEYRNNHWVHPKQDDSFSADRGGHVISDPVAAMNNNNQALITWVQGYYNRESGEWEDKVYKSEYGSTAFRR